MVIAGGVGISLGGHEASAIPPPCSTSMAPSYAGEERPAWEAMRPRQQFGCSLARGHVYLGRGCIEVLEC
jgi:hypothetical protein